MKLILASLFTLLGISRFFSFPVDNELILNDQRMTYTSDQDTTPTKSFMPEKVTLAPFMVLTISDTAKTTADFSRLLNKSYGELFAFINRQQLRPGKVMAFYYSSREPFIFDAAVEVDKIPADMTGKIKGKRMEGGDAVVVHYQGPYHQIAVAYTAIANWLKENNKKAVQPPFEVYLNDPASVSDPQQLRTDVYQLIE